MKLIDFDGLFDKKLADYMEENYGKYSEKQWEAMIPGLYAKFGDTFIKVAQNTPKGYYAAMDDETLVKSLALHVEKDVPVSDFLCRELEKRNCPEALLPLLESDNEQLLTFAVNLSCGHERAFPAYFRILETSDSVEIKDTVAEQLKGNADCAREQALSYYRQGIERELMLEILSRCKQREDRIFDTLVLAFRQAEDDDMPMRASYLAAYGDDRALPILLETIDREDINFLEFQELKYAIEALGGKYTRERDFSEDKYFLEIERQSQMMPDFTEGKTDA